MNCFERRIRTAILMLLLLLFSAALHGCRSGAAGGDVEGTHESDVKALERILEEQTALGGTIPADWEDTDHYTWDENGRLTEINWRYEKTLKGNLSLEGLTALIRLNCEGNELTGLDISKNTELMTVCCNSNELKDLDVSRNLVLTHLLCDFNALTDLDVSKNTALLRLSCSGNKLSVLNIDQNIELALLWCGGNQLTNLDVSKNLKLKDINCCDNELDVLDISSCSALELENLFYDEEAVTITGK